MDITVNGVTIDAAAIAREAAQFAQSPDPDGAARRALAVRELLRQRAHELGFDDTGDGDDALIARVLDAEVDTPAPTETECRRYYDTHPDAFTAGELVEARHILFAVTPGTPVAALRVQAESLLGELTANPDRFADRARDASNCPSAQHGGNLGQFGRGQMVPEFERAVFGSAATGVLPQLVQTRYGFHIVDIVRRIPGRVMAFDQVKDSIADFLAARVQAQALTQYVRVLAGNAQIEGVDLDGAPSPLLQ